eukprot:gene2540-3143_t
MIINFGINSWEELIQWFLKENKYRKVEHLLLLAGSIWTVGRLLNNIPDKKDLESTFWKIYKTILPSQYQDIQKTIQGDVKNIIKENFPPLEGIKDQFEIPENGLSDDEILKRLKILHDNDIDPKKGKLFAYCYPTNEEHESIILKANNMFIHLNALNPIAFKSLRRMEVEVVQMTIQMLNGGPNVRGTMTSGGTESLLMALKTYRDMARDRAFFGSGGNYEIVLPITAHPAIEKGCKYFGLKPVYVPIDEKTGQIDLKVFEKKITRRTILLLASAPQYPHGVLDPIEDIAKLAIKYGLPFHVDACIGGFFLPWLQGDMAPKPFDFRVKGVTSISVDIHKYGYATKGSSVILYSEDSIRKYQFLSYANWPGGLFVSPSALGTRSGASIAVAWTSLVSMGGSGFRKYVNQIMNTANLIRKGISTLGYGFHVIGNPAMSIISFTCDESQLSIHAVADQMQDQFGWRVERQHRPNSIHMTLSISHIGIEESFIKDLKSCVQTVLSDPELSKKGSAAMYSGISKVPLPDIVDEFLVEFLSQTYTASSTIENA